MTSTESSRAISLNPNDVVTRTSFFAGLDDETLTGFAECCESRVFYKDSAIYQLGDPADEFFILVDGMVRFSLGLGPMHATAGEIIRCGDVFGWAALVEGWRTRLATAYCLTSSSVLAMPAEDLLGIMERNPAVGYQLMKRLNTLITGNLIHFAAG